MSDTTQRAYVGWIVDKLHEQGSWCGETHIQKTIFICQDMAVAPLDAKFILYKFGPFSFDLRQLLVEMRARHLLSRRAREMGVSYFSEEKLREIVSSNIGSIEDFIDGSYKICRFVGSKNVTQLERESTAVFVNREVGADADLEKRIEKFLAYKPHIQRADAREAFEAVEVGLL